MRLFIAIPLQKDIQNIVYGVQEQLRQAGMAGRFVPQGNHHITLHFFGESDALVDIADAMHEAVKDAKPFLLRLSDLGAFAHGGARTSILRVGGDCKELLRIHQTLESALTERGFVRGRGRLEPHITLARAVTQDDAFGIVVPNEAFWVRSIVLFDSRNEGGRMVYTPVHTESF